jgi:hypothetical protein
MSQEKKAKRDGYAGELSIGGGRPLEGRPTIDY